MGQSSKWDATLYDEKHSFVWKMAAGLLELLDAKPGERILDIGCGTGHLTAQIAATGAQVTGIDRSAEMIEQARAAHPAIHFEVADARDMTFPEPFDAVFSNATLHWITEPERAVTAIASALRSGGRFVAEFGGKGNVAALMAAFKRAWKNVNGSQPFPNPWYYPSLAEYASLLERHGLEVTYGTLFDRPTPLEDGERGLRNWVNMFGGAIVANLPAEIQERLKSEVEREARPHLFHDGRWVMDYRRLRIVARKL
ncbi:MAG TPA: methyltransferase domain-containing protein [Candidatus Limnocylindrales bacterium]|nr:methyltransferase domain-containing protein [Candidatus Limnocylindrales bacterium]